MKKLRSTTIKFFVHAGQKVFWVVVLCSLLDSATGAETEKQEAKLAFDQLRREYQELKKASMTYQRDWVIATNRVAWLESRLLDPRAGLVADDEDARSAEEWRALLVRSLKVLHEAAGELEATRRRMEMIMWTSEQTLRSATGVDGTKRSALESELREGRKFLESKDRSKFSALLPTADLRSLNSVKVLGVKLDLGVVALTAGSEQGMKVGMPFVVVREKKVIAVLIVAEVRERKSLAIIEKMDTERPVKEGDTAQIQRS